MKYLLILLISFVTISSIIISTLLLLVPDGSVLNLSLTLLKDTPLKDFQLPSLLLLVIIGFTFLLSLYTTIKRNYKNLNYAIFAGIVLCLWIVFQILFVPGLFWLNVLYLFIGISIVLVSFQLKGKILL